MGDIVKVIVDRLTKYEWLNILMPGCFFQILGQKIGLRIAQGDTFFSTLVLVVLWGLISSCIGSTVIEKSIKRWVPFAPYKQFIDWEQANQEKANLMVANLNMFRSLSAMSLLLVLAMIGRFFVTWLNKLSWIQTLGIRVEGEFVECCCLLVLFVWSYIRQIQFIKVRVEKSASNHVK